MRAREETWEESNVHHSRKVKKTAREWMKALLITTTRTLPLTRALTNVTAPTSTHVTLVLNASQVKQFYDFPF